MPTRAIDLNQDLEGATKAVLESARCEGIRESAYDTKVLRMSFPERVKLVVGTDKKRVDFINSEKNAGVSPWVGITNDKDRLQANIVFLQEAYLKEALSFALKATETTKDEWTLVRPFEVNDKPVYLNHESISDNVANYAASEPYYGSNNVNYSGAGMLTVSPRVSMNQKDCTLRFKLLVKAVGLFEGRAVDSFVDDLFDVDVPEGMEAIERPMPSKKRRH
tara:strand:+ start:1862 stop:2524 length:663 start_codon:yes stop_codon:yes gene_type:complete